MSDISWLVAAVATSAFAIFTFAAQKIVESRFAVAEAKIAKQEKLEELKLSRLAQLKKLQSLLRASHAVYNIQAKKRNELNKLVKRDFPQITKTGVGYEDNLSKAYPLFDSEIHSEHIELHKIIRGYTIYAIRPLNLAVLNWLQDDTYFKSRLNDKNSLGELANKLANLEIHLLLWIAKYEMWIPKSPEHCLVYMADEKDHGLGFPKGIENLIEEVLVELA
ncbi:MAG TPA: hypothetical protein PLQ49_05230 [Methanothrix sp.]|nr:hypothetical protein [Methanothrix sp.]